MKLLPIVVLVVALLVVACGGGSDETPTPTATSPIGSSTATPTESGATATPTQGGNIATATPTQQAGVTATPTAPEGTPTPELPDFDNAAALKSLQDFVGRFAVLEYEWSDESGTVGSYRMEYMGTETVNGVQADHVTTTVTSGDSSQEAYEIWTDEQNTIVKLVFAGEEVPAEQLSFYAPLATAVFFAPLAAMPDISEFDDSYFGPGGLYGVKSSRTESKDFGGVTAETTILEVTVAGEGNVIWEISDFGDVSLLTAMRFEDSSGGAATKAAFEVTEVQFRN